MNRLNLSIFARPLSKKKGAELAAEWLGHVGRLLITPEVMSMGQYDHHFAISCYQHSVFVSFTAFRIAKRMGWDAASAARAGLLHDLYLYQPYDQSCHPGNQCLDHPLFALMNARTLCPDLTDEEQNAIATHMWPLALHMPRNPVAVAVTLADKVCASIEILSFCRVGIIRRLLPSAVPV